MLNIYKRKEIEVTFVSYCIHRIASGGYYRFDLLYPPDSIVTPTPPPPQCVERFHRYRSNEKNIIASLLKFAGYIHSHKILPGNIFGLILKNKMAAMGVFSTLNKDFWWPSRAKGIIEISNSQDMFLIIKS